MKTNKHNIKIIVFINLFYSVDNFDLLLEVMMSSQTVDTILFNSGRET